jgi:hypothetical protein
MSKFYNMCIDSQNLFNEIILKKPPVHTTKKATPKAHFMRNHEMNPVFSQTVLAPCDAWHYLALFVKPLPRPLPNHCSFNESGEEAIQLPE